MGRRSKDEMVNLLVEEDKKQCKIVWGTKNMEEEESKGDHIRGGGSRSWKEEEGARDAGDQPGEEDESEWVDIPPTDQEDNGSETQGEPSQETKLRMPTPHKVMRRTQGGRGTRGFWVKRREEQVANTKGSRVKGFELEKERRAGPGTTTVLPPSSNLMDKERPNQD